MTTHLRCKDNADDDRNWPYPLEGIGDAPSPFVCPIQKRPEHTSRDQLSDDPLLVIRPVVIW